MTTANEAPPAATGGLRELTGSAHGDGSTPHPTRRGGTVSGGIRGGLEALLSRLDRVHRSGDGYRADCPAGHAHARGSLSLREAEDGRILLHCFACGGSGPALAALGLELADLFPERIKDPSPEARRAAREAFKRSAWAAALGVLARESGIVLIAARDLRAAGVFAGEDAERLALAVERIEGARGVLA